MTSSGGSVAPSTVADVARLLPIRVAAHYGDGPRVELLRRELASYTADDRKISADILAELETVGQGVFRHLELSLDSGLQAEERSSGWPPPETADVQERGAQVGSVVRHPGGAAVWQLDGLASAYVAAPLLAGAFALCSGARLLVLDLRRNRGGDPATVAAIVDWLAAGPPHLIDVRYQDHTRQWWTAGAPLAASPGCPVVAVIGPVTYSSGEALAWVLQQQRPALLVGRATRGAADHVLPLALTSDVRALIPEATFSAPDGSPNWEGSGVLPDQPLSLGDDQPLDLGLLAERVEVALLG